MVSIAWRRRHKSLIVLNACLRTVSIARKVYAQTNAELLTVQQLRSWTSRLAGHGSSPRPPRFTNYNLPAARLAQIFKSKENNVSKGMSILSRSGVVFAIPKPFANVFIEVWRVAAGVYNKLTNYFGDFRIANRCSRETKLQKVQPS